MIWLVLLGIFLLLCLPWLLLKRLEARHKQREQERRWRENADHSALQDRIATQLRSRPTRFRPSALDSQPKTPTEIDDWDQLRNPEPQTKTVRKLPPPEYHWLKKNHRQNIQAARQELDRLREQLRLVEPDQALKIVIGSLRRIDPFVFEELLLHCFKEQGCQIMRNERYTGDEGIDGRIYRDEKLFLVQAKRYSGHIDAAHLREFETVIEKCGAAGGYFVHTGRTGKLARGVVRLKGSKVVLLSGMKVVDLVLGRGVLPRLL